MEIHRQPLGIEDKAGAGSLTVSKGEIAFDHVDFQYGQHATPLYRDLSVTIRPGERVGLVGYSGSGKSTFVKLIERLYDVTGGRITIDGTDIRDVRQASLRSQIAIVQQEPILFHRSLAENIAYGRPGASRAEIERQRVAIARAFLAQAPILILDEATSSLDSESELLIQQAMERLMDGRTTLVIAHRLSTVRALDRLLVFDRGRIAEEGTHEALSRHGGIYRRLFDRQALELTRGLAMV